MTTQTPAIEKVSARFHRAWQPPPKLTVSEWAGRFRYLSPEASAEPGLWQNARAPHLVAVMDALSPHHHAERVVGMFSSQSGKTEVALNFNGYVIDCDPGPTLVIQPNVTPMGEAFSKDRLAPMLRDSPSLADKVGKARSRDTASTLLHKKFSGGHVTIAGANSPAGLASRPIRYLIADEIDRWEPTKEGDPLLLARKRLQTFRVRRASKELIVSSPTFSEVGISAEYNRCTQQFEWHLPCLHCGVFQFPRLEHFHYDNDDRSTLRYVCAECGGIHPLEQADKVKAGGKWVMVKDGPPESLGFWFNQWASPFARWDDTLHEWLLADDSAQKQVVTNTVFAEPWEGEGEKVEPHLLSTRAEDYEEEVPAGGKIITIGADVQNDRIEAEAVAWGANNESWSIAYEVFPGEPTSEEVWEDLVDFYRIKWNRAGGGTVGASCMCVDSGAFTTHVYAFIKRVRDSRIIPVKGAAGMTRDAVAGDRRQQRRRAMRRRANGKPPEIIGVDGIKRTLYHWFVASPGEFGYCHFPKGRPDEYYQQLTGERLVLTQVRGKRPDVRWVPIYDAVEALDCRVYAYAALLFTNSELTQMQLSGAKTERALAEQKKPKAESPPQQRRDPRLPNGISGV